MKSQIRVAVTAIGGPTGHGILKCLHAQEDIYVIGLDADINCFSQGLCNSFVKIPRLSEENYLKEIEKVLRENKIDILFPTLQDELEVYDEIAASLGVKVAKTIAEDYSILLDKDLLYEYLLNMNCGKYIPKYTAFINTEELTQLLESEYKLHEYKLLKPCSSHGGIGVMIITNHINYLQAMKTRNNKGYIQENDAIELFENINQKYMIMEYLQGEEWSIDVLKQKGSYIAVVPRKRSRVSNGIVIDGQVSQNVKLIEVCKEIVDALNVEGFLNLQFILGKDGEYKLFDLNPRFCGSQVMSYGAGVNFPYLFIQNTRNYRLQYPIIKWNTGMKRYWETYYYGY